MRGLKWMKLMVLGCLSSRGFAGLSGADSGTRESCRRMERPGSFSIFFERGPGFARSIYATILPPPSFLITFRLSLRVYAIASRLSSHLDSQGVKMVYHLRRTVCINPRHRNELINLGSWILASATARKFERWVWSMSLTQVLDIWRLIVAKVRLFLRTALAQSRNETKKGGARAMRTERVFSRYLVIWLALRSEKVVCE